MGICKQIASIYEQCGDPALTNFHLEDLTGSVAQRTFALGRYDAEAEIHAHRELTGATVQDSYLVLSGRYQLALLSSRPDALPRELEKALLDWVWHRENGIGYLGVRLSSLDDYLSTWRLDRWLASLELLSRFPGWRE
jgi:hypothetical protein